MSWNVRSLRDDRAAIVRTVRSVGPDVLCLQEAPRFLRSRSRLAGLARDCGLVFVCGGRAASGPALLVTQRVDTHRLLEVRFPRTPGLHLRGLAAADVSLGRLRLAVGSVHLGLDGEERVGHAARVRSALASLGQPLLAVAGDLNESPGGAAWQRLADGLVDVLDVAGQAAPTYPAARPRRRIDAVLLSPGIAAAPVPISGDDLARATDHLPIAVDLVP